MNIKWYITSVLVAILSTSFLKSARAEHSSSDWNFSRDTEKYQVRGYAQPNMSQSSFRTMRWDEGVNYLKTEWENNNTAHEEFHSKVKLLGVSGGGYTVGNAEIDVRYKYDSDCQNASGKTQMMIESFSQNEPGTDYSPDYELNLWLWRPDKNPYQIGQDLINIEKYKFYKKVAVDGVSYDLYYRYDSSKLMHRFRAIRRPWSRIGRVNFGKIWQEFEKLSKFEDLGEKYYRDVNLTLNLKRGSKGSCTLLDPYMAIKFVP